MESRFTNSHSHIFTVHHAPDYFLKTVISNTSLAELVQRLLEKKSTRKVLSLFHNIIGVFSPDYRDTVKRYIEFIEIGTSISQQEIYYEMAKTYKKFGSYKIIVLTQVLDYLDLERPSNHIKIQTQVEQVCQIKRNALFQDNIFPFLGLDPRQTGIDLLNDWVAKFINKNYGFYGIKIYPAAGFFPFDSRLDKIWKWAEDNEVPIMTHCTRSGSFYLGRFESILSSGGLNIESLNPDSPSMDSIKKRVKKVIDDGNLHNKNHIWCNIFGHPENYRPVLEKYPNLKICLAHLGGATEVNRSGTNNTGGYPDYLQDNWYEHIKVLMTEYENVYSDISYTLSDENALQRICNDFRMPNAVDNFQKKWFKKLLYGTDFYLTQQETKGDEPDLQNLFLKYFNEIESQLLAFKNPDKYLSSNIHIGSAD